MPVNLYEAHYQWANRPPDERFESISAMESACISYKSRATVAPANPQRFTVVPDKGELLLTAEGLDQRLTFTDYGFRQFCSQIKIGESTLPPAFLRACPPELAAVNMNCALALHDPNHEVQMLLHQRQDESFALRASTSQKYARIWNADILGWLKRLPSGWRVPPARPSSVGQPGARIATEADCMAASMVRPGDVIAPAGLYASAHDMFAYLIDTNRTINVGGETLSRGFFVRNSEVGDAALRFTVFYFDFTCGNHIVWNVSNVRDISIRHIGDLATSKGREALMEMQRFANSSTNDEQVLQSLRVKQIAAKREDVINLVADKGILSQKMAETAYKVAVENESVHGDPKSYWGFHSAITRMSQKGYFADKRADLDRAAGKLLKMGQ